MQGREELSLPPLASSVFAKILESGLAQCRQRKNLAANGSLAARQALPHLVPCEGCSFGGEEQRDLAIVGWVEVDDNMEWLM